MQKERWHQVEEIYNEALKHPAEGRAAFLENPSGMPSMR